VRTRPLVADWFCGAGGASRGYYEAGFDVEGIDCEPQPNYEYAFTQGDALELLGDRKFVARFDGHVGSPPCQDSSISTQTFRFAGKVYPQLIPPVRELFTATGKPWVIENVPGAPLRADYTICGCQVGLKLRRKRLFETSWHGYELMPPCHHPEPVVSVVGHGSPAWVRKRLGFKPTIAHYRAAMGIDWMNRDELSQAIPPAYTRFIGERLMQVVRSPIHV
jgi:DNA (cytosine-5)-methyltransferase 1